MILVGAFQVKIFYDSMILKALLLPHLKTVILGLFSECCAINHFFFVEMFSLVFINFLEASRVLLKAKAKLFLDGGARSTTERRKLCW